MTVSSNSSDRAGAPIEVVTHSADETRDLGRRLGSVLTAGDVVLLGGELGSGKTTLTGGIADALGIDGVVTSPTFTLVNEYAGSVPVAHIDLYRLEMLEEVEDLGLDDLLAGDRVIVVEWGDVAGAGFGPEYLSVRLGYDIETGSDDRPDDRTDNRTIRVWGTGRTWATRWPALREHLS